MDKIKMIVMDMDGTLLTSNNEISHRTKDALIEAEKKGIKLVLASGRSFKSLIPFGEELKMPFFDGYYIGANGATLTNANTKEHTVIRQLQLEEISELFEATKPFEIETMAVLDDTIYDYIPISLREIKKQYRLDNEVSSEVPWTAGAFSMIVDQRKNYNNIYEIQDHSQIPCPVNKICLAHTKEALEEPYKWLVRNLGERYHFARTTLQWIECAPQGINKGNAIRKLADELGIRLDQILVFGDGENDLTMFEAVKYPIAMGNAMDKVKEAAYSMTLDNNNDGIADFLMKNILC